MSEEELRAEARRLLALSQDQLTEEILYQALSAIEEANSADEKQTAADIDTLEKFLEGGSDGATELFREADIQTNGTSVKGFP